MIELAEMVFEIINSKSGIEFKALPEDDPKQRQPDISLAKSEFGWELQVNFRDDLAMW